MLSLEPFPSQVVTVDAMGRMPTVRVRVAYPLCRPACRAGS